MFISPCLGRDFDWLAVKYYQIPLQDPKDGHMGFLAGSTCTMLASTNRFPNIRD